MPVGTYRVQSPGFPKIVYYVNMWWVCLAPQNIPSAIALTLGNEVVLYSDSLHGLDELARRRLIDYIGSLVFRWEIASCHRVYYKLARGRLN